MPDFFSSEHRTYALASWFFLRVLGAVFLIAFLSLAVQVRGLFGARGISPISERCPRNLLSAGSFLRRPSLFWFRSDDNFLFFSTLIGVLLSTFVILGVAALPSLFLLWFIYLSFVNTGGVFFAYQWDSMLLEAGLLATLVTPWSLSPTFLELHDPPVLARILVLWLLFRALFSSGVVKLRSGDPTWRDLTALEYHYETQPLPTPLAWFAHQATTFFHRASAGYMFLVELVVPFFLFVPGRAGIIAALGVALLMVGIAMTGSYGFFNLLTLSLALFVFDDQAILGAVPASLFSTQAFGTRLPLPIQALALILVVPATLETSARAIIGRGLPWPAPINRLIRYLVGFRLASPYGLFAVMTTHRPVIILEGSNDAINWIPYELRYMPSALDTRPRFAAPHQPRLEWQLWFAALSSYHSNPWFLSLIRELMAGSRAVAALFASTPFGDDPPKFLRASWWNYEFTSRAERSASARWWSRSYLGLYLPPVRLANAEEEDVDLRGLVHVLAPEDRSEKSWANDMAPR